MKEMDEGGWEAKKKGGKLLQLWDPILFFLLVVVQQNLGTKLIFC